MAPSSERLWPHAGGLGSTRRASARAGLSRPLAGHLAHAPATPSGRRRGIHGRQEHGLTATELQRLRAHRPWLEAACDELAAASLPQALEHGDLWVSNIFVGGGEPTFIDWTDACLSHPFLSLGPLLRSADWDPHLIGDTARQDITDAYLEAWSAYASPARLRQLLKLAEPLAALHIAVSIWAITLAVTNSGGCREPCHSSPAWRWSRCHQPRDRLLGGPHRCAALRVSERERVPKGE